MWMVKVRILPPQPISLKATKYCSTGENCGDSVLSLEAPVKRKIVAVAVFFLSFFLLTTLTYTQTETSLVERVGDTGFIRVQEGSFAALTAKQQELAYWLCQASIAIDPYCVRPVLAIRIATEAPA